MMKVKKVLYILTGMMLLTACSGDNDGQTPAEKDARTALQIVAGIDLPVRSTTRAVETAWEASDMIGVYMTEHGTANTYKDEDQTEAANMPYIFDDGTNYETNGNTYRTFSPTSKKIYLSTSAVDVFAYYPYTATPIVPDALEISVADQSKQEKIDFMRAKTESVTNSNASIRLLFYHKLVKLVFNLKQGEGLLTDELASANFLGIKVKNQPPSASYNLYTDAFSGFGSNIDIVPVESNTIADGYVKTFEAIVLPSESLTHTVEITFYQKLEDKVVNTFTINTALLSGHKYTYNVTVNANSINVDLEKYTEQW